MSPVAGTSGTAAAGTLLDGLQPMRWWDLDDVLELERPAFADEAWSRESFLSELAEGGRTYAVLREGAHLLAYLGVAVNGPDADVQTVAVAPDARGRGLGRRLVADACAIAREAGARWLRLEVREDNAAALALYRGCGFEVDGRRPGYYAPAAGGGSRVAAVLMRRDLAEQTEVPAGTSVAGAAGVPGARKGGA